MIKTAKKKLFTSPCFIKEKSERKTVNWVPLKTYSGEERAEVEGEEMLKDAIVVDFD